MPAQNQRTCTAARGDTDTCELYCFNEDLVYRLRRHLPQGQVLDGVATFFSALGSRTRLLVLYCLCHAEELCVCDIANALRMNLSTISHQLRYLRGLGLVTYRSQGRMAFYRLADSRVKELIRAELAPPVACSPT